MPNRFLLLFLGVATAMVAPVSLAAAQAASSTAAPSAPGQWVVPRTPDGRPDLQGNWSSATITPLNRPEGQGPILTWEEVQSREGRAAGFLEAASRPSDPDRGAPRAGGGVGGYNLIYIDRGDKIAVVHGEPRSSLITHPANGRTPDFTPEAEARRAERRESRSQFGQYDHPELRPLGERCLVSRGRIRS